MVLAGGAHLKKLIFYCGKSSSPKCRPAGYAQKQPEQTSQNWCAACDALTGPARLLDSGDRVILYQKPRENHYITHGCNPSPTALGCPPHTGAWPNIRPQLECPATKTLQLTARQGEAPGQEEPPMLP